MIYNGLFWSNQHFNNTQTIRHCPQLHHHYSIFKSHVVNRTRLHLQGTFYYPEMDMSSKCMKVRSFIEISLETNERVKSVNKNSMKEQIWFMASSVLKTLQFVHCVHTKYSSCFFNFGLCFICWCNVVRGHLFKSCMFWIINIEKSFIHECWLEKLV